MANKFNLSIRTDIDINKVLNRLGINEGGIVQKVIDSEVLRLNNSYIPKDTGQLIRSGQQSTEIGSGEVVYQTPYARKQYYIPMEHEGQRTNYWFEHMKADGGKEKILNAARKALGKW